MQTVWVIPDIPAAGSPLALIDWIDEGLPVRAVDAFARRAGLEPATRYRIVGKATLARRRTRDEPLSREEGARLARTAKVRALAEDVWRGREDARAFLHRPRLMLDDRRPVDVTLDDEFAMRFLSVWCQRSILPVRHGPRTDGGP